MWSEDQVKEFVHKRVKELSTNPSAIALGSYYKGCDWRFDKLRAFCEQEVKNYTQELLRQKQKQHG